MSANHQNSSIVKNWNETELESWYSKGEWKQGWGVGADASIDKKEFAVQYFKNQERWDKAFQFLATAGLMEIGPGKYTLEEDALFANIDEYQTKNEEETRFEAHQKYADIQYLIKGNELIGLLPLEKMKEITVPYDEGKDLIFYRTSENNNRLATHNNFFIFFPNDAHKPCLKVNNNENVKKVVVKVRLD